MRWLNKITNKKAAYDYIQRERPYKTLEEIARGLHRDGYSASEVHPTWVGKICRQMGVEERPYRPRYSRLKKSSVRDLTAEA
jgi:hypothetical protein